MHRLQIHMRTVLPPDFFLPHTLFLQDPELQCHIHLMVNKHYLPVHNFQNRFSVPTSLQQGCFGPSIPIWSHKLEEPGPPLNANNTGRSAIHPFLYICIHKYTSDFISHVIFNQIIPTFTVILYLAVIYYNRIVSFNDFPYRYPS